MRKIGYGNETGRTALLEDEARLFMPVRTRRAFEEISAEIKRLVFSGVLKPGDRLPPETELAVQFGVSRHTIREALRRLEIAGFIAMQKGGAGGPLIVDTILNTIGSSFLDAFLLKKMTIHDLMEARLEIEKMVLRKVVGVISQSEIALLRESLTASKGKAERGMPTFEDDIHFHKLLAKATKNYVFDILMESLMAVVAHFHSLVKIGPKTSKEVARAHEQLLDALEHHDKDIALDVMEKHILDLYRTYEALERHHQATEEGE